MKVLKTLIKSNIQGKEYVGPASGGDLKANITTPEDWQQFYVEFMETTEKGQVVALKAANCKYVSMSEESGNVLIARSSIVGPNEKFTMSLVGVNDKVFLNAKNGKYVSVSSNDSKLLQAVSTKAGDTEEFQFVEL